MPTPHLPPYHPRPAELDPLRRLLTNDKVIAAVILGAVLLAGAWQWAHL